MRKRLVRKAFDMILGISCSENRDVSVFISFVAWFLGLSIRILI